MGERTLTTRELNRALLARQMLLERSGAGTPEALRRMSGLQAQYAPSMYVGLWTRLRSFRRGALTRALERRSVVQATLMRGTIHLVARDDYWPFEEAVRERRRAWAMRAMAGAPSPERMRAAASTLRAPLAEGPLTRAQMQDHVGRDEARLAGMWVDLVRVPPSGTWERRRADLFGAAEEWIGPSDATPARGAVHLVRRYLAGFGPATRHEAADFAGLTLGDVDEALARLDLRRFRAEDGSELLDLPRAPLPAADTPAPPRLLPTFDATLLVHARRAGVLAEEHRPKVFSTRTPQSVGTFLLDGCVAGTWTPDNGRIELHPFGELKGRDRRALEGEAEALAAFRA